MNPYRNMLNFFPPNSEAEALKPGAPRALSRRGRVCCIPFLPDEPPTEPVEVFSTEGGSQSIESPQNAVLAWRSDLVSACVNFMLRVVSSWLQDSHGETTRSIFSRAGRWSPRPSLWKSWAAAQQLLLASPARASAPLPEPAAPPPPSSRLLQEHVQLFLPDNARSSLLVLFLLVLFLLVLFLIVLFLLVLCSLGSSLELQGAWV